MQDQTRILRTAPEPMDIDQAKINQSDAELTAGYAREALALGRYALAVELTRLAARAHSVGARPAGHDAAQRALFGPGDDRVRDVPLIGQTRDEAPRDAISHAPSICTYRSEVNGSGQLCHQPVAWAASRDGNGWPVAGWYHLDPEITDHAPEVAGY